jgi:hypothetical protein
MKLLSIGQLAIGNRQSSLSYRIYRYRRVTLTVTLFAFVLFAAFLFENHYLGATTMIHDCCGHGRVANHGIRSVSRCQQSGYLNGLASLRLDGGDAYGVALANDKLLAAGPDHCV